MHIHTHTNTHTPSSSFWGQSATKRSDFPIWVFNAIGWCHDSFSFNTKSCFPSLLTGLTATVYRNNLVYQYIAAVLVCCSEKTLYSGFTGILVMQCNSAIHMDRTTVTKAQVVLALVNRWTYSVSDFFLSLSLSLSLSHMLPPLFSNLHLSCILDLFPTPL